MEQGKNKKGLIVLLAVLVVILIVLCVLFTTGTISFNPVSVNNDENIIDYNNANNNKNSEDVHYQISYENKVEENFGSDQLGQKYNFKIVDGYLSITDVNNISYKVESISNVKNILLLSPTSADNTRLFILTATGKVYMIENIYNMDSASDFKNYKEIKFNGEVEEIGYTTEYVSPPISKFLVLKSNNKEYVFINTTYDNYVEINSQNIAQEKNKLLETIKLTKEKESFDLDKLHLDFEGVTYKTDEGHYQYVLNIKYDGKNIDSTFFNDKNNYRIWSHNMAADFKVYKIENVYILVSFIAKQCFYDEIMIFNTNGDVLKTFTTAHFDIDGSSIKIRTSDTGQCMGPGAEEHVKEYNYEINNSKLIEQ